MNFIEIESTLLKTHSTHSNWNLTKRILECLDYIEKNMEEIILHAGQKEPLRHPVNKLAFHLTDQKTKEDAKEFLTQLIADLKSVFQTLFELSDDVRDFVISTFLNNIDDSPIGCMEARLRPAILYLGKYLSCPNIPEFETLIGSIITSDTTDTINPEKYIKVFADLIDSQMTCRSRKGDHFILTWDYIRTFLEDHMYDERFDEAFIEYLYALNQEIKVTPDPDIPGILVYGSQSALTIRNYISCLRIYLNPKLGLANLDFEHNKHINLHYTTLNTTQSFFLNAFLNENKEQKIKRLYLRKRAKKITLERDFVIKVIQPQHLSLFLRGVLPPYSHEPLRIPAKTRYTKKGDYIKDRATNTIAKRDKSPVWEAFQSIKYPNHSKSQSATLGTSSFHPKPAIDDGVGILLECDGEHVVFTDSNYTTACITYKRPHDHTQTDYLFPFTDHHKSIYSKKELPLFKKHISQKEYSHLTNEVKVRLQWPSQSGYVIYTENNLQTKVLAQYYAEKIKNDMMRTLNIAHEFKIQIIYYNPKSPEHLKLYDEEEWNADKQRAAEVVDDVFLTSNANIKLFLSLSVEILKEKILKEPTLIFNTLINTNLVPYVILILEKADISWDDFIELVDSAVITDKEKMKTVVNNLLVYNYFDFTKQLLKKIPDKLPITEIVLYKIAEKGDAEILNSFTGLEKVSTFTYKDNTPLHIAILHKNEKIIPHLLDLNFENYVMAKNLQGLTPIDLTLRYNELNIFNEILDYKIKQETCEVDKELYREAKENLDKDLLGSLFFISGGRESNNPRELHIRFDLICDKYAEIFKKRNRLDLLKDEIIYLYNNKYDLLKNDDFNDQPSLAFLFELASEEKDETLLKKIDFIEKNEPEELLSLLYTRIILAESGTVGARLKLTQRFIMAIIFLNTDTEETSDEKIEMGLNCFIRDINDNRVISAIFSNDYIYEHDYFVLQKYIYDFYFENSYSIDENLFHTKLPSTFFENERHLKKLRDRFYPILNGWTEESVLDKLMEDKVPASFITYLLKNHPESYGHHVSTIFETLMADNRGNAIGSISCYNINKINQSEEQMLWDMCFNALLTSNIVIAFKDISVMINYIKIENEFDYIKVCFEKILQILEQRTFLTEAEIKELTKYASFPELIFILLYEESSDNSWKKRLEFLDLYTKIFDKLLTLEPEIIKTFTFFSFLLRPNYKPKSILQFIVEQPNEIIQLSIPLIEVLINHGLNKEMGDENSDISPLVYLLQSNPTALTPELNRLLSPNHKRQEDDASDSYSKRMKI